MRIFGGDCRKSSKKKEKKPFRESDLGVKNIAALLYGDTLGTYSKDRLRTRKSISWAQLGNDTYTSSIKLFIYLKVFHFKFQIL